VLIEETAIFFEPTAAAIADALPKGLRPVAGQVAGVLKLEQAIFAPLPLDGVVAGLLVVAGSGLTEADVPAVAAFANQAAIALENTQLLAQVRGAEERLASLSHQLMQTQEAERRRIARGLHDEVGQALAALRVNLQAVQRSVDDPAVTSRLEDSIRLADDTRNQVRDLSLELRPTLLDDLGLVPALRWYIDRQAQRARFLGHLSAPPGPERRLPSGVEIACFRVVQEALTNVARHSRAQRVEVELRECEGELLLAIHDDGVGFDVETALREAAHGKSMGLLGMQEWVRLTGGEVEIESARGEGVSIRARFPRSESPPPHEEGTEEHWH
jgi:signal transduction histidine kinase